MYDKGIFTTIEDPSGFDTVATGINDSGEIVGYFESNETHGFLDIGGTFTTIDYPGSSTYVAGINDSGQIVGLYDDGVTHGFLATPVPEPRALPLLAAGLIGLFAVRRYNRRGTRT